MREQEQTGHTHSLRSIQAQSKRGEVLVVIMNDLAAWRIVREQGWYRIPVRSAPRRWPPKWLAFYQTKIFGKDAYAIHYVAKVIEIKQVSRRDLFPDEQDPSKADRIYHQVFVDTPERLPEPIPSIALRRIAFIPTTIFKLEIAVEINDLFDDSPLEDALWQALKSQSIPAERQYFVEYQNRMYALDFAVFCREGKLDIETDGDAWHADAARIPEDNMRNNAMAALGYQVLRFNTMQIREQMSAYCIPEITRTVNRLGGAKGARRANVITKDGIAQQLTMFEDDE